MAAHLGPLLRDRSARTGGRSSAPLTFCRSVRILAVGGRRRSPLWPVEFLEGAGRPRVGERTEGRPGLNRVALLRAVTTVWWMRRPRGRGRRRRRMAEGSSTHQATRRSWGVALHARPVSAELSIATRTWRCRSVIDPTVFFSDMAAQRGACGSGSDPSAAGPPPHHLPMVSLGRAPNGHAEPASGGYASAGCPVNRALAVRAVEAAFSVAGGLVRKWTRPEADLNARRGQPGWLAVGGAAAAASGVRCGTNVPALIVAVARRGIVSSPPLDLELGRVWSLYSRSVSSSAPKPSSGPSTKKISIVISGSTWAWLRNARTLRPVSSSIVSS